VGVEYRQRRPYRIHSITVIASQNAPASATGPTLQRLQGDGRAAIIAPVFQEEALQPDARTQIFVNPDGGSCPSSLRLNTRGLLGNCHKGKKV
jgi:S-adenosylmethionine synthetase